MKDLYYIENVRQFKESVMALLQYIPKNIEKWELANRDFKWYVRKLVDPRWKEVIREGRYVYALGNEEYQIANEDLRVSQIRMRYGGLVDSLVQIQRKLPQDIFDNISILYTYHINV